MKMLSYGERATPLISPKVDRITLPIRKPEFSLIVLNSTLMLLQIDE
jgi:hypothetical protein